MKELFVIYTVIGLILVPFIHSNNSMEHRLYRGNSNQWAESFGHAFWWPSYLFSIEPEIDGDSEEAFGKSFSEIVKYRNEKLYTGAGQHLNEELQMMSESLSLCFIKEYFSDGVDPSDPLYVKLISGKIDDTDMHNFMLILKEAQKYSSIDEMIEAGANGEIGVSKDYKLPKYLNMEKISEIRTNLYDSWDGFDFDDVVEEGVDCRNSLNSIN